MKAKFIIVLLFVVMIFTVPTSVIAKKYKVNFVNSTPYRVRIAVVYNDVDDDWVAVGWVSVTSKTSNVYTLDLKSPNIYIYAQTEDMEWAGEDDDPSYPIADKKFYYSVKKHPGADFHNVHFSPFVLSDSEVLDFEFE